MTATEKSRNGTVSTLEGAALEDRVIGLLGHYASLQFDELRSLVFSDGSFSYARERELEAVLGRLVERGDLLSPGKWGPYQLVRAAPSPTPSSVKLSAGRRAGSIVQKGRSA